MKISDYVIKFISDLGVDKVFCVTGGGAMHLNNSLGSSREVKGVFMLHEQGASVAAESYARIREGYGVCLVTSGPGATNAITGLCGAYMDSIPVIICSASGMSVRYEGTTYSLSKGANTNPNIVLHSGDNTLIFYGQGTITIENTGGRL